MTFWKTHNCTEVKEPYLPGIVGRERMNKLSKREFEVSEINM
jgi:hypothetical protein